MIDREGRKNRKQEAKYCLLLFSDVETGESENEIYTVKINPH